MILQIVLEPSDVQIEGTCTIYQIESQHHSITVRDHQGYMVIIIKEKVGDEGI